MFHSTLIDSDHQQSVFFCFQSFICAQFECPASEKNNALRENETKNDPKAAVWVSGYRGKATMLNFRDFYLGQSSALSSLFFWVIIKTLNSCKVCHVASSVREMFFIWNNDSSAVVRLLDLSSWSPSLNPVKFQAGCHDRERENSVYSFAIVFDDSNNCCSFPEVEYASCHRHLSSTGRIRSPYSGARNSFQNRSFTLI